MKSMQEFITDKIEQIAINNGYEIVEKEEWANQGGWFFYKDNILKYVCSYDFQSEYVNMTVARKYCRGTMYRSLIPDQMINYDNQPQIQNFYCKLNNLLKGEV